MGTANSSTIEYKLTARRLAEDFNPIPALFRSDADVSLILLSANNVRYAGPIDDDWFAAHRRVSPENSSSSRSDEFAFRADQPVSVLGCATQYQFCSLDDSDSSKNNCTTLTGRVGTVTQVNRAYVDFNENYDNDQRAADLMLFSVMMNSMGCEIETSLYKLGNSGLLARDTLLDGLQTGLAPDQWELEVLNWHSTFLALMQKSLLEMASGPSDPRVTSMWYYPDTPSEKSFCQNIVCQFRILLCRR